MQCIVPPFLVHSVTPSHQCQGGTTEFIRKFLASLPHERNREEKLKQKINEAFKMFERHTEGPVDPGERVCDCREVRTIVRALDLNPTKEQLRIKHAA
eukprot:gene56648-biopygen68237